MKVVSMTCRRKIGLQQSLYLHVNQKNDRYNETRKQSTVYRMKTDAWIPSTSWNLIFRYARKQENDCRSVCAWAVRNCCFIMRLVFSELSGFVPRCFLLKDERDRQSKQSRILVADEEIGDVLSRQSRSVEGETSRGQENCDGSSE